MNQPSLLIVILFACLGCRSLSTVSDTGIIAQFDSVDALEVSRGKQKIKITSPRKIQNLKTVYANAKWSPWVDTMPSGIVHIDCKRGDETLFSLLYGTWLIEWSKETGPVRKAKLDAEAVALMQELTAALADFEE